MPLLNVSGEMGVVAFDPTNDLHFRDGGDTWAKIRCVAKARIRDKTTGTWSDGDPCFIDVYVNGKPSEHLAESISVGDLITVNGTLAQKPWTSEDGTKHEGYRIYADSIGVALRFTSAPTERTRGDGGGRTIPSVPAEAEMAEAPF